MVNSIAFSPDEFTFATGSSNGVIRFWDMRSGTLRKTLESTTGEVVCIAFSPGGLTLAAGNSDGTIFLWDLPLATDVFQSVP